MSSELQLIKKFILNNGELNSFKAGQLILNPEEEVNSLFLIKKGQARLIFKEI